MKPHICTQSIRALALAAVLLSVTVGAAGAQGGPANEFFIRAQDPTEVGQVLIDRVVASTDGWVAIYRSEKGKPDYVIGFAPVRRGVNDHFTADILPVTVTNDKEVDNVTDVLWVILHIDQGQKGVFEFPGADEPLFVDGRPVMTHFTTDAPPAQFSPAPVLPAAGTQPSVAGPPAPVAPIPAAQPHIGAAPGSAQPGAAGPPAAMPPVGGAQHAQTAILWLCAGICLILLGRRIKIG